MTQLVLEGDRAHATKLGSDPTNRPIFDAIHDVLPLIRERMVSAGGRPRRDVHIEDCRLVNGQFLRTQFNLMIECAQINV